MSGTVTTLVANAIDDKQVTKLQIFVDWQKIGECFSSSCTATYDFSQHPRKYAYLYARAFDGISQVGNYEQRAYSDVIEIGPEVILAGQIFSPPSSPTAPLPPAGGSTPVPPAPPVLFDPTPSTGTVLSLGTTQVTIGVTTDEPALCKYDQQAGVLFNAMSGTFISPDSTIHTDTFGGLQDGGVYTIHVKCQEQIFTKDTTGLINTNDFLISFKVASPPSSSSSAPTLSPTFLSSHLFLDSPRKFILSGNNFSITDTFEIRLKQGTITRLSFTNLNPTSLTTIEPDFTAKNLSSLPLGLYTLELERISDGTVLIHDKDILLTKRGDIPDNAGIRDGNIDIFDVSRLFSRWNSTNPVHLQEADINPGPSNVSQGKIDIFDANKMMANWTG
ncbi:hypothetical protein IID24_05390 [Patescibacteria group bacterium]|nr:hypothetical protein [Patescibacteria group bacterium]